MFEWQLNATVSSIYRVHGPLFQLVKSLTTERTLHNYEMLRKEKKNGDFVFVSATF